MSDVKIYLDGVENHIAGRLYRFAPPSPRIYGGRSLIGWFDQFNIGDDSPVLMLLILIIIGALLVPLHHKLEKWITKIMVEKNKKIRLDAAKETIAQVEPAITEDT